MAQKYFNADLKKLENLRIARGWSREQFASKAIVSTRTLDSIMAGKQAVLSTFYKLARALETPVNTIIADFEQTTPVGERRYTVTITLSVPYDSFDETKDLPEFLTKLLSRVGGNELWGVETSAGSTKILFYLTEYQHTKLIDAIEAKTLGDLHIIRIKILSQASASKPQTVTEYFFPDDELRPETSEPDSGRKDKE
jgi:transcriptional regulator with XRE-family HTH domain